MEIDTKMNLGSINGSPLARRSAPAAGPVEEDKPFATSAALEESLKNVPNIRPEAVARAVQMIGDENYPSPDTVRKLSHFLAGNLQSTPE
jgi:hypothetical protein